MSQQINLYDPALERQRDWLALENVVIGGLALVVVVGALGALARSDLPALTAQSVSGEGQVKALREQVAALGQRASSRKPDPRIEQELGSKRQLQTVRSEVLSTLRNSLGPDAHAYAEYLRGFARQTVSGLWLTGFAVSAAGRHMEIRGNTTDPALIPEYIRRLNREAAFQGQTFAALKLDRPPQAGARSGQVQQAAWHEFMLTPTLESKPAFAANAAGGPG